MSVIAVPAGRPFDVAAVGPLGRDLALLTGPLPPPGGTAAVESRRERVGGKGASCAIAAARLGASAALRAAAGSDPVGDDMVRQLAAEHVDTRWVVRRPGGRTSLFVGIVPGAGEAPRYLEDVPAETELTPSEAAAAEDLYAAAATVTVSLHVPAPTALAAAVAARGRGARVLADGAPGSLDAAGRLLAAVDVLRADQDEAGRLFGHSLDSVDEARTAAERLLARGPALVVLDVGSDGNLLVWAGGSALVPLSAAPTFDATGGGDAFCAGLAVGLVRGLPFDEAGELATLAAGDAVSVLGARP